MELRRIAFELDETLGVPIIAGSNVVGWQERPECADLLDRLCSRCELILWSVSPRRYVDKALSFGLRRWFSESYSWDEISTRRKDVRQLDIDLLVDESPHHQQAADQFGLKSAYLIVPMYGSEEDNVDVLAWARSVDATIATLSR